MAQDRFDKFLFIAVLTYKYLYEYWQGMVQDRFDELLFIAVLT